MNRREFIATSAAASIISSAQAAEIPDAAWKIEHGKLKQSVVTWCFKPLSVPEIAKAAAAMGLKSVELVGPEHWPLLKELGMTCAIARSHGFAKGFAHKEQHEECLASLQKGIENASAFGCPNIFTFSGFRKGITTEDGQKNMIEGLKRIAGLAEEKKVTVCIEMLNSKVKEEMKGHPDYFTDKMELAVEVCKAIGSPRIKVLFDIYHVQIMHGDVISRLEENFDYVVHVHTAGNPGRCEIDENQEINYAPIMQKLVSLGYQGFVGQEFIPKTADKLAALRQGVKICDIA